MKKKVSADKFLNVLIKLVEENHIKERECDSLKWIFEAYFGKRSSPRIRLWSLLYESMRKNPEMQKLWAVVKGLLILPNRQASVERILCQLTDHVNSCWWSGNVISKEMLESSAQRKKRKCHKWYMLKKRKVVDSEIDILVKERKPTID